MESEPERLANKVRETHVSNLVAFFRRAPASTARCVLNILPTDHWGQIDETRSFRRATLIAGRCDQLGFQGHKSAIIMALLHRLNPKDFPAHGSGFSSAAWLLIHGSQVDPDLPGYFFRAICTKNWLNWQYKKAACGVLASGLRLLAFNQPPDIARQFLYKGLGIRLQGEFDRFAKAKPEQQSAVVQLLGCADMAGWPVGVYLFTNISPSQLSRLPLEILPHKPEAPKVEAWQFQLWLGLRAYVKATGNQLNIDPNIIEQTLELWRVNLEESAEDESGAEHRVNTEMVRWLEFCVQRHPGFLAPMENKR